MDGLLERAALVARGLPATGLVAVAWEIEAPRSEQSWIDCPSTSFVWDTRAVEASGELVVGLGCAARIDGSGDARCEELERRAARLFADLHVVDEARPRCFGGLAFEPGVETPWEAFGDGSFIVPRWTFERSREQARVTLVATAGELASSTALEGELRTMLELGRTAPSVLAPHDTSRRPTATEEPPERFIGIVDRALAVIADGALDKVVLSRTTHVSASRPLERANVLRELASEQATTRFSVTRDGCSFLGATPERLVSLHAGRIWTEALAGSIERRGEPERERERLLQSDKDQREHAWVVRAIREALTPFAELAASSAPEVRSLRRVHHLATPIDAALKKPTHVLALVRALHPTPAVSGWPVVGAVRAIRTLEGRTRGWYASPVGWFDAAGEGMFVVAIRSALIDGDGATVFAGAGIVRGSDARAEWNETHVKQKTMLAALGVS